MAVGVVLCNGASSTVESSPDAILGKVSALLAQMSAAHRAGTTT